MSFVNCYIWSHLKIPRKPYSHFENPQFWLINSPFTQPVMKTYPTAKPTSCTSFIRYFKAFGSTLAHRIASELKLAHAMPKIPKILHFSSLSKLNLPNLKNSWTKSLKISLLCYYNPQNHHNLTYSHWPFEKSPFFITLTLKLNCPQSSPKHQTNSSNTLQNVLRTCWNIHLHHFPSPCQSYTWAAPFSFLHQNLKLQNLILRHKTSQPQSSFPSDLKHHIWLIQVIKNHTKPAVLKSHFLMTIVSKIQMPYQFKSSKTHDSSFKSSLSFKIQPTWLLELIP